MAPKRHKNFRAEEEDDFVSFEAAKGLYQLEIGQLVTDTQALRAICEFYVEKKRRAEY